jgi:hypothetical protein
MRVIGFIMIGVAVTMFVLARLVIGWAIRQSRD